VAYPVLHENWNVLPGTICPDGTADRPGDAGNVYPFGAVDGQFGMQDGEKDQLEPVASGQVAVIVPVAGVCV
jgi:hypothetical protein